MPFNNTIKKKNNQLPYLFNENKLGLLHQKPKSIKLGITKSNLIPSNGRQKQEDLVSSRTAWSTKWVPENQTLVSKPKKNHPTYQQLKPVNQTKQQKKTQEQFKKDKTIVSNSVGILKLYQFIEIRCLFINTCCAYWNKCFQSFKHIIHISII